MRRRGTSGLDVDGRRRGRNHFRRDGSHFKCQIRIFTDSSGMGRHLLPRQCDSGARLQVRLPRTGRRRSQLLLRRHTAIASEPFFTEAYGRFTSGSESAFARLDPPSYLRRVNSPDHLSRVWLSPEAQLLLLTAAVSPSDAALRQVLSAGIDWEQLCALAYHEKASSVLLRQLGRVGADAGSSGYQELRQLATDSVMQMLQLEQLLHQTIDTLAEHEIEAVLLKGAGLAYTAYRSFADRPMGDIDLLVRPDHVERAWLLLQQHGWALATDSGSGRYAGHHHLPPLFQNSGTFRLEIHEDILPAEHPFRFSADTLWQHAQRITVNGRVITVLNPVHQLWHACVHFAWSHAMQWGSWRALRDGAAITQARGFNWTEFVAF